MYRNILLLFSLFCTIIIGNAQTISGKIIDENAKPIFFATIALYNTDSTMVQAVSSDEDGSFILKNIKEGTYFLEATMVGYKKGIQSNLKIPNTTPTFTITLLPDVEVLETAVVKARRPLLEQHADKLVVNVADNITSLNSNLLDVMKKVPGVIVTGDKIKLAGSSNLTILINGKTTKYMDVESLMKDMPGDNIQKVEIIHQPGAEFDAAGTGPIINVILKKNSLFGTTGSVNVGVSKAQHYRFKTGLNLSHYQGSVNINAGLGYRNSKYTNGLDINRRVQGDEYIQVSDEVDASKSFRGNLSLDWDINNRHRVGFQSRITDYNSDDVTINDTEINFLDKKIRDLRIRTDKTDVGSWKLKSINPYYTFEIDTSGQKLEVDFNYITYANEDENLLKPYDLDIGTRFTNQKYNQPGVTSIYVGKIDYSYPFSKALKLQIGSKYSLADLDNDLQANNLVNGKWVNNSDQSNHFLFKETILAGYSKLSYKKDKWAGTLGLRYEDSMAEGRSVGLDTTLSNGVSQFFPSASLSRDIVKGLTGIASYSYRLDRPQYSSLNPFRYALDSYTSQRGNPNLRPEFTHSMKFSLAYENQPFFNVEYKTTKDAMVEVIEQNDETGEAFKSETNMDYKTNLNINIGFPLDFIPHISGIGYFAANQTKYDSKYLNDVFDKSIWDFTAYMSINFELPWEINSEMSGWYNSGGIEGLLNSEWMYGTSIGFSKRFLNEKLKVSIGMDNPFNKFYYGNVKYSNIDMDVISTWDAQVFNVQVHYKFGNQHFIGKKTHRSGASEELDRAGKN